MQSGQCLCGDVRFEIDAEITQTSFCHCGQCRRQSGNYWASGQVLEQDLRILKDMGLTWFRSSDFAQRGFCKTCGSFLFWKADAENSRAVSLASLDAPHNVKATRHIFVDEKGSYYEIADDLPQFES
ncbi:MAG: GFA family protein [Pseudomonadota bacterium]